VKAFCTEQGVAAEFCRFLPHDRFILTDRLALEIGRGMNFLHRDGCNLDVRIATNDTHQTEKLLGKYGQNLLSNC
jgi:hypothetical protein